MASYRDDYYKAVDSMFEPIRNNPFRSTRDPLPQESSPQGTIEPSGWVQNPDATVVIDADGIKITNGKIQITDSDSNDIIVDGVVQQVKNSSSTVVINSTGITITNGKLTLSDQFGNNVITGAGFGASWLDFISSMFYNSNFGVGSIASITDSEVNTGGTNADYLASLSTVVPYWVCSLVSGAGTFARVADTDSVGGAAVKWTGTKTTELYQDIPIVPGQAYSIYGSLKYTNSSSSFYLNAALQFRDATHAAIGSEVEQALLYSTSASSYYNQFLGSSGVAPANARYLRVRINYTQVSGSPSVWLGAVWADPVIRRTAVQAFAAVASDSTFNARVDGDTFTRFNINASGKLEWGSGSALSDVSLSRSAAGKIVTDGFLTFGVRSSAVMPNWDDAMAIGPMWRTSGTGSTDQNHWTILLEGAITSQFSEQSNIIEFMGIGSASAAAQRGRIRFRVKQQNALGGNPSVVFECYDHASSITPSSDLVLVVIEQSASRTRFQVWMKITSAFTEVMFMPVFIPRSNSTMTYYSFQSFQAAPPSGTGLGQTFATSV